MTSNRERWGMLAGSTLLFAFLFILPALVTVAPDDRAPDSLNAVAARLGCQGHVATRSFERTYTPVNGPFGRWIADDRNTCLEMEKAVADAAALQTENIDLEEQNRQFNIEIARARQSFEAAKQAEEIARRDEAVALEAEQSAVRRNTALTQENERLLEFSNQLQDTIVNRDLTLAQREESLREQEVQNTLLRDDLTELTQILSQKEQELTGALVSLSTQVQQNDQLTKIRATIELRLADVREQKDLLDQSLLAANTNLVATQDALAATQDNLAARTDERDDESAARQLAQDEIQALNDRLLELSAEKQAVSEVLAVNQESLQARTNELGVANTRIQELDESIELQIAETEVIRGALVVTESELTDRIQQITDMEAAVQKAELDLATMQFERDIYRDEVGLLTGLTNTVAEWDATIDDLNGTSAFARDGSGLVVTAELFDPGSPDLRAGAEQALEGLAQALLVLQDKMPNELEWSFLIRGHSDSEQISTERFPSNWELSAARAATVARFMIASGVEAGRLQVTGQAEFQAPTARNIQDRRVTVDFQALIYNLVSQNELQ